MGFDSGLNNSFQIDYDQVDSIFFPEVEKAVMVSDQERGIMASQLAYYEGIPLIFDSDHSSHFSEVLDLSNFSLEGIQDLYLDGVVEDGGNIDYLIITNPDFNESLLAGYLSGIRRGFVILTDNRTFESINRSINDAIDRLSGMGLFSSNLNYIKGDPLYLAILGGNDSIPFVPFFDMSLELFNDKDGFLIHSDVWYADVDGDGLFELAPGRIAGDIGSVSLQLSGLVLPRRGNAALIGEYRHNMFVDLLLFYGGMPQAFTGDLILKNAGIETERIVEERIKMPEFSAYSIIRNMMISVGEDAILYLVMGKFAAVVQTFERVTTIFYTLFEFDILEWVSGGSGYLPDHLPVIGEGLNGMIGETEILGYFGLGEDYWVIPPANRSKWDLILWPYRDSTELTVINHSRFLYADHDMSSGSAITRGVLERGGSALASSGIIHDPYSLHSSVCFIEDISSGKSVGSSLLDTLNFNALDYALTKVSLNPMDKYGDGVYWKNKLERILFSDPAYRPVERAFQEEAYEYEIMPSGSFLIESEITGDYIIENRALFFRNVDSYLTKQGKPIIPVFSREFILPRGSSIKSVDFDGTYSNKWMIKKEFVYNDSHYTNYSALVLGCIDDLGLVVGQELTVHQERRLAGCIKARAEQGIEYPFPEKNYWYRSNELLDGRVLVTVIVPGVLHRDRSVTEVLERGRVTIDYETPYEMSVDVNDTVLGENVSIVIHLYNEGSPLNGTLFVWIQNASASFTENVLVPEGGTVRSFEFCPGSKGIYKVVAVFSSDIPIGPRAKGFKVGKLDIEVNKEFKPNPIRKWRLRFSPKLPNKPRVTIKNLGGTRIKSVMIDDEIPEGFRINNWGRWIPLFVYLKREGGKWRFDMLGRDDYDYRIENGHLIVKIPDMEETISGECLEKGDELMIDYIMSMASVPETQDIKTKVKVATPNGMSLEKEITEELKVV